MLADITFNHTMVVLVLLLMAGALVAIFFVWHRCFHPRIDVLAVQDEFDGPEGQLCGEITLKIDFYAPPFGVLHLWSFHLLIPKKFLDRNIRVAFITAKEPAPCEWTEKQHHDAIRRHGVLAPNQQCSTYVTVRMIVPAKQRKGRRLWAFFLDNKLSIAYDVSGRGKKQKIPSSSVEYVHEWHLLPRLFENREYRHVIANPHWELKGIGLAAIKLVPFKSHSDLEQEQYAQNHELNFPFGTPFMYSSKFIDEWNSCYNHYATEIASRQEAD